MYMCAGTRVPETSPRAIIPVHMITSGHAHTCAYTPPHTHTNILSYTITHIKKSLLLFKPLKMRASQLILYFGLRNTISELTQNVTIIQTIRFTMDNCG